MSVFNSTRLEKKLRDESRDTPETKHRVLETRKLCSEISVMIPHRPKEGIKARMFEHTMAWLNGGVAVSPFEDHLGGHIDVMRANMVKLFLRETSRRYLVMIDNDVVPDDRESILRLCAHDLPVVSGVACALRPGTGVFACVAIEDETGVSRFPTVLDTKWIPSFGVRKVSSAGAGILAIRRDVLESILTNDIPFLMPQELRIEAAELGRFRKSEDIWFCEQVKRSGFDMYVDFSVHAFHDKTIPLHWPSENIDEELDAETWNVTRSALAVEMQ